MGSLAPLPFHLVNVFTATPHAGSQAAVILIPKGDPRGTDEDYKLALASDFSLPATVFLIPMTTQARTARTPTGTMYQRTRLGGTRPEACVDPVLACAHPRN